MKIPSPGATCVCPPKGPCVTLVEYQTCYVYDGWLLPRGVDVGGGCFEGGGKEGGGGEGGAGNVLGTGEQV